MQLEITEDERIFLLESTYETKKEMIVALDYLHNLKFPEESAMNVKAKIKVLTDGLLEVDLLRDKLQEAK